MQTANVRMLASESAQLHAGAQYCAYLDRCLASKDCGQPYRTLGHHRHTGLGHCAGLALRGLWERGWHILDAARTCLPQAQRL